MKAFSAMKFYGLCVALTMPACKTVPDRQAVVSEIEAAYTESVGKENYELMNPDLAMQFDFQFSEEFWELYEISVRSNGAPKTNQILQSIITKRGISVILAYWISARYISDADLRLLVYDSTIKRTKRFEALFGDPVNWDKLQRNRTAVPKEGLERASWPRAYPDGYTSDRARLLLYGPRILPVPAPESMMRRQ